MKILDKEVSLRNETRSVEQARPVTKKDVYPQRADGLATRQRTLGVRTAKVVEKIRALPNGASEFRKEIDLLSAVQWVMVEAASILARPDTGPPAIAAETEAIELLLQAKRANSKGRGSGGNTPGGGGSGTTQQPALALLGDGSERDAKVLQRQLPQQTGASGRELPDEFRHGLDTYFSTMEEDPATQP